jgi:hypothetical protein
MGPMFFSAFSFKKNGPKNRKNPPIPAKNQEKPRKPAKICGNRGF